MTPPYITTVCAELAVCSVGSCAMIPAHLSLLLLFYSMALDAAQTDQGWTAAGITNGVTLTFRDDPQLNARQVRAVAELPHAPGLIIPVVCDFTQILDPTRARPRSLRRDRRPLRDLSALRTTLHGRVGSRRGARRSTAGQRLRVVGGRRAYPAATRRRAHGAVAWIVAVEPIDSSRSRVTYQIAVRPGGSIPRWVVRRGAVSALPEVIGTCSLFIEPGTSRRPLPETFLTRRSRGRFTESPLPGWVRNDPPYARRACRKRSESSGPCRASTRRRRSRPGQDDRALRGRNRPRSSL